MLENNKITIKSYNCIFCKHYNNHSKCDKNYCVKIIIAGTETKAYRVLKYDRVQSISYRIPCDDFEKNCHAETGKYVICSYVDIEGSHLENFKKILLDKEVQARIENRKIEL